MYKQHSINWFFPCIDTPVSTSNLNSNASGSISCGNRSFRNDLLVAADSVTNAMSSLVKELNSGMFISVHISKIFRSVYYV